MVKIGLVDPEIICLKKFVMRIRSSAIRSVRSQCQSQWRRPNCAF